MKYFKTEIRDKRSEIRNFPFFYLLLSLFFMGCEQDPEDTDNAIVSGYIYKYAVPANSVWVDTAWKYVDWDFYDPVEGVHVWIEEDAGSPISYRGPDIDGYTHSTGFFSIPIYLGHTEVKDEKGNIAGYDYVYYADVRVFAIHGHLVYNFGGGITLERGREFRLYPIALAWFTPPGGGGDK